MFGWKGVASMRGSTPTEIRQHVTQFSAHISLHQGIQNHPDLHGYLPVPAIGLLVLQEML